MSEMQRILVVEDEAAIRDMLAFTLGAAGYEVVQSANAEQAWQQLQDRLPDLVLLDWMLPGTSGVAFLQRLRKDARFARLPVIMLTAKGEELDQVEGFEAGADDYVVKPFSPRALVARIGALLRRGGVSERRPEADVLKVGDLVLERASHRVRCKGKPVALGPTEYRLLDFFMHNPDRVFTRTQLLDQVWGNHVVVEERTVDVHIRRLRKALEPAGCERMVQTVRGAGYRLSEFEGE
ncbi:two component transcriptional regulator, winged helix family [Sulfurivirga caldicuralii]|uniref:Phosphate regulon transcriptional regulatory protein PhoB n=2 Tax=Sulfurivirga caldicuralii TaxID=364032 RepID=A0A1N6GDY3_9GAMM|nr:two component transcriptional regulator, winged helix family [Sulfurivirga caldicuralii]